MNILQEFITRSNVFFIQWSQGRLGSQLGRVPVLLLFTKGRKTGKIHVTPLAYCRDGGAYLLVASNWGGVNLPDWYLNLLKSPSVQIRVGSEIIGVESRPASTDEYERLWNLVASKISFYSRYQRNLSRRIPVVILTPV